MSRAEIISLKSWVDLVAVNKPVHMIAGEKMAPEFASLEVDRYVIVDASKIGWGAVIFNKEKKFMKCIKGVWPKGEDYSSSVKAEPQGIREALYILRSEWAGLSVAVLTDHENLVHASHALFIHNFLYNRCLAFIEETRTSYKAEIFLYFLEGLKNNADNISRGKGLSLQDSIFPKVEGTGLGSALPPPQWMT